jgi:hypothetical protein
MNKNDTIFVDLGCFLNKMETLKNHSDNLMVDLQLLISNLKSCSYIKKMEQKNNILNNPFKPIDDSNMEPDNNYNSNVPKQDTIKVFNSKASVLYTNNPTNNTNVMLGITEHFDNSVVNENSVVSEKSIVSEGMESEKSIVSESSESENTNNKRTFLNSSSFKIIILVLIVLLIIKIYN